MYIAEENGLFLHKLIWFLSSGILTLKETRDKYHRLWDPKEGHLTQAWEFRESFPEEVNFEFVYSEPRMRQEHFTFEGRMQVG